MYSTKHSSKQPSNHRRSLCQRIDDSVHVSAAHRVARWSARWATPCRRDRRPARRRPRATGSSERPATSPAGGSQTTSTPCASRQNALPPDPSHRRLRVEVADRCCCCGASRVGIRIRDGRRTGGLRGTARDARCESVQCSAVPLRCAERE